KVGASHHGDKAGTSDIAQREYVASAEDRLHVSVATGVLEGGNLVVEFLPPAGKNVSASDNDVNLMRAGFHGTANFGDAFLQRREPGGKSGGDGGYTNACALGCPQRRFGESVINTNCGYFDSQLFYSQFFYEFMLKRLTGFGAEAAHTFFRIVARKGGQIHAGNRTQLPCCLPFFFYGPAGNMSLCPALYRAGIDVDLPQPVEIQG